MKKYKNVSNQELVVPNYGIVKPGEEFVYNKPIISTLLVEVKEEKKVDIKPETIKQEEIKK